MPHGPDHAVVVAIPDTTQGPLGGGGGGRVMLAWWPDRRSDMSGSGPLAPIFVGVWQSSQPMAFTRYLPRATEPPAGAADPVAFAAGGAAAWPPPAAWPPAAPWAAIRVDPAASASSPTAADISATVATPCLIPLLLIVAPPSSPSSVR